MCSIHESGHKICLQFKHFTITALELMPNDSFFLLYLFEVYAIMIVLYWLSKIYALLILEFGATDLLYVIKVT